MGKVDLCADTKHQDVRRPGRHGRLDRDRGSNFPASFDAVFQAAGTRVLRAAVQAPRMNAISEQLVGTLRRELLDRMLILGEAHLRSTLAEYQANYNMTRPHQGIAQRIRPGRPDQRILTRRLTHRRTAGHDADPIFERVRAEALGGAGSARCRLRWPLAVGSVAGEASGVCCACLPVYW